MKSKILKIIFLTASIAAISTTTAFAADEPAVLDGQTVANMTQEEIDQESVMGSGSTNENEDDNGSMMLMTTAANAWAKKSDGTFLNGNGTAVLKGAKYKGIDVSKWQGTINWKSVSKTDVSFAIIRLGWGSDYSSQDDSQLKTNIAQCEKYGIPYGFYLYSYANTAAKNTSEIAHVLRLLKDTNPDYPVYYDMEDANTQGKCQNTTIQKYALNYCKAIKAAGYTPGIYANLNWWRNKLDTANLNSYERWVAQYNNSITAASYSRTFYIWQSASDYTVSGISGNVDLNFAYKDFVKSKITTGWVTSGSKKYYYDSSGNMYKSKWFTVSGKTYYATSDGSIYMDTCAKIDNKYYAFDSTGARCQSGWARLTNGTYYVTTENYVYTSCCKKIGSYYYGFSSTGSMYKSGWFTLSGNKYYAKSDGSIYVNKWQKLGNYYYGFNASGVMYHNGSATVAGKHCYFLDSGYGYLNKVKTTAKIYKRASASSNGKVKGTVSKNSTLYIIRKSGSWWQTSQGCWVSKKYLKITKTYPY